MYETKKILIIFRFFIYCRLLLSTANCFSQDIHFSQFYQTPLYVNPALTGVFNGDVRACINYKDQWKSVTGIPAYRTSAVSYDMGLFKKKWENSYLGVGLFVFSDKAGDTKMGTTQANFSLSSIIAIAEGHQVSAGVQGGFAQRSINTTNPDLRWELRPDGTQNIESIGNDAFFYPDFSAGASWNYGSDESAIFKNNSFRANAGIAYQHFNSPNMQFYNTAEKLYSKIVAHGGTYIGLSNSNMALLPSLIYFHQGRTRETDIGMLVRYTLKEESKYTGIFRETAIYLGGFYRIGDAFIPSMMVDFSNFTLGITYDVNISQLKDATHARGGIEISLRCISPNPFRYKYGKERSKSVRFL